MDTNNEEMVREENYSEDEQRHLRLKESIKKISRVMLERLSEERRRREAINCFRLYHELLIMRALKRRSEEDCLVLQEEEEE